MTPVWSGMVKAREIALQAGIVGPFTIRLTTKNAEALIEELKSIGQPAAVVWRVGEQLLSLRAKDFNVEIDDTLAGQNNVRN